MYPPSRATRYAAAAALCTCCFLASPSSGQTNVPEPYRATRNEAGHEFVKTEQFVVPVGRTVVIKGLEFPSYRCRITDRLDVILRQVFDSIEEITENTVNDPDAARVAEFSKMRFEIRAISSIAHEESADTEIALRCGNAVKNHMTTDGTPAWRLDVTALADEKPLKARKRGDTPSGSVKIAFVRVE